MKPILRAPPQRLMGIMGATVLLSILPFSTSFGGIKYSLYVKDGAEGWSLASDGGIAGTTGQSRKTDAFSISGLDFPVEFRIHVERDGWHNWTPGVEGSYDSGVGKRLEAIQFRFPQGIPAGTVIVARAHVQGIGWMPYANLANTDYVGTTGQSRRLEAIQIAEGTGANANEAALIALMDKAWKDAQVAKLGPPSGNPNYDPRYPYGKPDMPGMPIPGKSDGITIHRW